MNFDKLMTDKQKDLFWDKVDIRGDDECWLWTGMHNAQPVASNRRGLVWLNGERHVASRVAWSLHNKADIPDHLFACHHCDQGLCCSPNCIKVADQFWNMRDASLKGRLCKGTDRSHSRLTDLSVILARHAYSKGLLTVSELGKKLGVNKGTIHHAVTGKTWKHVTMPEESTNE
jgi:hypothetical protein